MMLTPVFSRAARAAAPALAWLALCAGTARAQQTGRINLGTLAPRGSTYHQALQALGETWKKASDGKVKLVIYPDGTQGSEGEMVKLMRAGTLHAGLLTSSGLNDIDRAVTSLQELPMAFRTLEEYEAVHGPMRPVLEERLEAKGFVTLFWVNAGWLRHFTKEPMRTPADFKRARVFVWAGDEDQVRLMRNHGYTPVPLETSDILPGLQSGMITAVTAPPIFALATQLDTRAKHMLELNYVPLIGALVIKKDAWGKLPKERLEEFRAAAEEAGRKIRASSLKESQDAVEAMKKRGLVVQAVGPELEAQWREAMEELYPSIRGNLVPAELFDEVREKIREVRARADAGSK